MKTYPDTITDKVLAANAHISNAEVERDIAETEAEIDQLQKMEASYTAETNSVVSEFRRRMAHFRANNATHQIAERRQFIDFLKRLLAARRT